MSSPVRVLIGDALGALGRLESHSADVCVTSPPYWAKARYTDDPAEIGRGSLEQYLSDLVAVFAEVRRVLSPTGLLWLNVGETASGSGGSGGDYNAGGSRSGDRRYRQVRPDIEKGQWCLVPWRLVQLLQSDGWLLRSCVVWDKGRTKRESLRHARRPGEQWEPIFMLSPAAPNRGGFVYPFDPDPMTQKGNVWTFPPAHDAQHPAVFPPELVRRCLEPMGDQGVLLDPFCGTGTSLAVAAERGMQAVGIDLDSANVERIRARLGMFVTVEHVEASDALVAS